MRSIRTLYLTGPQFGAHAELTLQAEASALCAAAGFELAIPDPDTLKEEEASEALAREIYAQRVSCLRRADAVIVDLTPLRGPAAEPTAAFEAGFAAGLGRPVFAYLNVREEAEAELATRIEMYEGAEFEEGALRDASGVIIEDYGLPEALMLWAEARRLFVIVTPDPLDDLTGLHMCLEAIKLYGE